jgi:hypothetical protein
VPYSTAVHRSGRGTVRVRELRCAAALFYELTELRDLGEAVRRLAAHDDELAMWRLYR